MLGVNNFINPEFARESLNVFLKTLYTVSKNQFNRKDPNDSEELAMTYTLGINHDDYMIRVFDETVKDYRLPFAFKYLSPWMYSFNLEKSPRYHINSVLVYSPGHFTSLIKTSDKGWVRYNDLSSRIEVIGELKSYSDLRKQFNDDLDICSEEYLERKIINDIIDSHEEYWGRIDTDVSGEIRKRTVIQKDELITAVKNKTIDNFGYKKGDVEYNTINLLKNYYINTDFREVNKIFDEKIQRLMTICSDATPTILRLAEEVKNIPVNELIAIWNSLPDQLSLRRYAARFAVYDQV
jgi:hypothetical protein